MSGGSQQLRTFRRAYRDTGDIDAACEASGITPEEARLHIANDAKNPPPPEAFEPIGQSSPKEKTMAAAAEKDEPQNGGEYQRPNIEQAWKIYDSEIKPKNAKISTIKGDLSDPHKRIKDDCNMPRSVLNFVVGLEEMEDAKCDHHLLALYESLKHRGLHLPSDLVTKAQGVDGGNVVPIGERERDQPATLQMGVPSDGTETDLADAGEEGGSDDDFQEASDEEIAAQKPRAESAEKKKALKKGSVSSMKPAPKPEDAETAH